MRFEDGVVSEMRMDCSLGCEVELSVKAKAMCSSSSRPTQVTTSTDHWRPICN